MQDNFTSARVEFQPQNPRLSLTPTIARGFIAGMSATISTPISRALAQESSADLDLLRRICAQDERALETLYDKHSALVYAMAMRIVGDRNLAQEILQDCFLRAWNSASQFDIARGNVSAWLVGIARNRAIDVLRSKQHQARLKEDAMPTQGKEEIAIGLSQRDPSDAMLLRSAVRDALGSLSDEQRQVIEMAYYEGLSQSEISTKLDTPLGTVKTRMRDGMEKLRKSLGSFSG